MEEMEEAALPGDGLAGAAASADMVRVAAARLRLASLRASLLPFRFVHGVQNALCALRARSLRSLLGRLLHRAPRSCCFSSA